jgi:hypothetical protein
MYEKDEDDYNVGAEWRMAKGVFKGSPTLITNIPPKPQQPAQIDSMQYNAVNRMVAQGARQFEGHEDVIKRFLG